MVPLDIKFAAFRSSWLDLCISGTQIRVVEIENFAVDVVSKRRICVSNPNQSRHPTQTHHKVVLHLILTVRNRLRGCLCRALWGQDAGQCTEYTIVTSMSIIHDL